MKKLKDKLLRWYIALKHNEKGATAVEYALIVALIAIVIIVAVTLLGTTLRDIYNQIAGELGAAN